MWAIELVKERRFVTTRTAADVLAIDDVIVRGKATTLEVTVE